MHWYDHNANEIEDYVPTSDEIGQTLELHGPILPPTRMWPDEGEFENKPAEDGEDE